MLTCLSQEDLWNNSGTSDKLYIVQVQRDDSVAPPKFLTVAYYGRRGQPLRRTQKFSGTSQRTAENEADNVISTKRSEGYGDLAPGMSVTGLPPGTPTVGAAVASPSPIVPPPVPPAEPYPFPVGISDAVLKKVLVDDNYLAMPFPAGNELMVLSLSRGAGIVVEYAAPGVKLPTLAEASLNAVLATSAFDGGKQSKIVVAIRQGVCDVFDLLMLRSNNVSNIPYLERLSSLEILFESQAHMVIHNVWSYEDKEALISRMEAEKGRVVFCSMDSADPLADPLLVLEL